MGWEGRCRVWEIISYLINEDLITDLNYTPCRHLLLKYLDRSLMVVDDGHQDSTKATEKTYKEMRANQQEWSSNAMLYLLKLTLMAMAGYVQHRNSPSINGDEKLHTTPYKEAFPPTPKKRPSSAPSFAAHDDPARVKDSPTVCKVKSNNTRSMTFPDADAFSAQLFSPSKLDNRDLDHEDNDAQESIEFANAKNADRKGPAPNWLTVSSIQFAKEDEVESLWLATVVLFADYCNIPSLPVIHRAEYCLEVLISAGNISFLPVEVWFHALDELISHLPIGLVSLIGKMTSLAQSEVNEVCCRCCNIIFHVLVFHIKELRKHEHFAAMYIRAISAMAGNASISQKGQLIHEEMLGMVIALLRLLRLPQLLQQIQAASLTEKKTADQVAESNSSSNTNNNSTGLFGVLQWIISTPPPPPTTPPTISKDEDLPLPVSNNLDLLSDDHDGILLLLSWKAIFSLYPSLPVLIKSWDMQLFKSLHQAMELTEQLRIAQAAKVIKSNEVVELKDSTNQLPEKLAEVRTADGLLNKTEAMIVVKVDSKPPNSGAQVSDNGRVKPIVSHPNPTPIDITTVNSRIVAHQQPPPNSKPLPVASLQARLKLDPKSPVQIV